MKILTLGLVIAFTSINSSAQVNLVAKKYSQYIDTQTASKHLGILASDDFEGRETGKPGAAKAAKYLAEEFNKLGLQPPINQSFYQDIDLVERSIEVNSFSVNGNALTHLQDFYIRNYPAKAAYNFSEVIFGGYGISAEKYDDFKGINIAGKAVIIIGDGEPVNNSIYAVTGTSSASAWKSLSKKVENLQLRKPSIILIVNAGLSSMLRANKNYLEHHTMSINKRDPDKAQSPDIPIILITPLTANLLLKQSGKTIEQLTHAINGIAKPLSQPVAVKLESNFGLSSTGVKAVNVLGYLEGSDSKNELLIISAHYDHVGLNAAGLDKVFNGADDDGSGTTAVLEIAEAFSQAKKEGKGPKRSILFLLVAGEEKGLLGSEWYSEYPVFPLKNTVTDLNIDMIGRVDPAHNNNPDYCYLIGSDKLSADLHRISEQANATYTKLNLDYKYNDPNDPERIYYRSDHYNFAKHGIPIIFYFNGVHEDYHKPGDEVSKINFSLLVKRAQLVFFTAWEIANRNKRLIANVKSE